MSVITFSPTYSILARRRHRLMGSFDPESSIYPRNLDEINMNPNDINPIIENNSSHSYHDEDEALRVPPMQVQKLSHDFEKFEQWLGQENSNLEVISTIEGLRKIIHNDEHGVNILRSISHLINNNVNPIRVCAQELGFIPPTTTSVESSMCISTSIPSVSTYDLPIIKNSIQNLNPTHVSIPNLIISTIPSNVPCVSLPSSMPTYNSVPFS